MECHWRGGIYVCVYNCCCSRLTIGLFLLRCSKQLVRESFETLLSYPLRRIESIVERKNFTNKFSLNIRNIKVTFKI